MPFSPQLTTYLSDFAALLPAGTGATAYTYLVNALNSSASLLARLDVAATGVVDGFTPVFNSATAPAANFNPVSGLIEIAVTTQGDVPASTPMSPFVLWLGHEVKQAAHVETNAEMRQSFEDGVAALSQQAGVQDYSQLLLTAQHAGAYDEAIAHIVGWNDMVSYLRAGNPSVTLNDAIAAAGAYASAFFTSGGSPVAGLIVDANLSFALTPQNIAAVGALYFESANTVFGQQLAKPDYYASTDLKYIVDHAPPGKVALDFSLLNLDAALIQSSNSLGLVWGGTTQLYDPTTEETFEYEGTETGVTRSVSKPVPYAAGEKTETYHYSENGSVQSLNYHWTDSNGGGGNSSSDLHGTVRKSWVDASGKQSWENTYPDGASDSGYSDHGISYLNVQRADGSYYIETRNDNNGTFVRDSLNPDGSRYQAAQLEDGSSYNYFIQADGSYSKRTIQADGSEINDVLLSDGSIVQSGEFADGSSYHYSIQANGAHVKEEMDAAGNSWRDTVSANGYHGHWVWNADGSETADEIMPDGFEVHYVRHADGSSVKDSRAIDGSYVLVENDDGHGHTFKEMTWGTDWHFHEIDEKFSDGSRYHFVHDYTFDAVEDFERTTYSDGAGYVTDTTLFAGGRELYNWTTSGGDHGTNESLPNGDYSLETHFADNRTEVFTFDADTNTMTTTIEAANGTGQIIAISNGSELTLQAEYTKNVYGIIDYQKTIAYSGSDRTGTINSISGDSEYVYVLNPNNTMSFHEISTSAIYQGYVHEFHVTGNADTDVYHTIEYIYLNGQQVFGWEYTTNEAEVPLGDPTSQYAALVHGQLSSVALVGDQNFEWRV